MFKSYLLIFGFKNRKRVKSKFLQNGQWSKHLINRKSERMTISFIKKLEREKEQLFVFLS